MIVGQIWFDSTKVLFYSSLDITLLWEGNVENRMKMQPESYPFKKAVPIFAELDAACIAGGADLMRVDDRFLLSKDWCEIGTLTMHVRLHS